MQIKYSPSYEKVEIYTSWLSFKQTCLKNESNHHNVCPDLMITSKTNLKVIKIRIVLYTLNIY